MGVLIEDATIAACERLVATLRAHLPAALAALAEPGLYLPAPDDDAYYLTGETVADIIAQQPVVVVVEQVRPARYDDDDQLSGDGVHRQVYRQLPLRLRLLFTDTDAYEPVTRAAVGREQLKSEWMLHRARRYGGAIAKTLMQRAQDDLAIERLQPESDWVGELPPGPDSRARVGGVIQEWRCWQACLAPMAQY